ncbi:hypothetical protein I7I48_09399 [Histoplasma ohiense]|nr:hypothetical protein I7I48_09399 [Histoplasma ohiense (nom. inval.)]
MIKALSWFDGAGILMLSEARKPKKLTRQSVLTHTKFNYKQFFFFLNFFEFEAWTSISSSPLRRDCNRRKIP